MDGYWQHPDGRWVSVETVATLVTNPLDANTAIPSNVAGYVVHKPRIVYGDNSRNLPSFTAACSAQELGFMLWLAGFRRVT